MCLLEEIVEWNDASIRLRSATHCRPDNPLRSQGRLRAIHLCEYGAQAMAVHGALRMEAHGETARPGLLVSLRSVTLSRDYVEDLGGELQIEAVCLLAMDSALQYSFRVTHAGEVIVEGRAAVMLGYKDSGT